MSETPPLRALASAIVEAGAALVEAGGERRAAWLATAFAALARPEGELGSEACRLLAASSGLSEPMVAWALETTLAPLTFEALRSLEAAPMPPRAGAVRARPGQLCAVVLAGNVPIAAARAVGIPLLFGWPVLCKASSDDDALARLLEAALAESDPALGAAFRVVRFAADDAAQAALLLERADAVSAYGSDATLQAIRARVAPTAAFIGHGHGLGAALIGRGALRDRDVARSAARGLALDVAAYDQRGCLSPHVAWVERGGGVSPEELTGLLHEELALLSTSLPRGKLPVDAASAQLSWRGIAAMRGSLLEGEGFALCFEEDAPLRVSPGYRNLQVIAIDDVGALLPRLAPLGVHLKCLGLAGIADARALASRLPPRVAPRLCPVGRMQRPDAHAVQDGLAPWAGLVRWTDLT